MRCSWWSHARLRTGPSINRDTALMDMHAPFLHVFEIKCSACIMMMLVER